MTSFAPPCLHILSVILRLGRKKSVCARFPRSTPQRCTQINRISQRTRLAHFTLAGKIVQREENRIEFFTLKALKTILTDAVPRSGREGNVVEGVPVDGSFGQEPIGIERLRVLKVHPAMKSLIYLVRWIANNPKKSCAENVPRSSVYMHSCPA